MIVRIYKEEDGAPVMVQELQEKIKKDDYRTLCSCLERKAKEYFGCDRAVFPGLRFYQNPEGKSTFRLRKGSPETWEGRNRSEMSASVAPEDAIAMSEVVYRKDGVETAEKFGAEFLYEGFVIDTGKTVCNVFGQTSKSYLIRITKRQVKYGGMSSARKFQTAQAALRFIRDNQGVFGNMVSGFGWKPELQFCSAFYKDFIEDTMTEKKKEKMYEDIREANSIFARYGSRPARGTMSFGTTPEEEAVFRMKELGLYGPVIRDFRGSGRLYMSEFGGILYDLDDGAKEAVSAAEKRGYLPYHVVRNNRMYSVLCVSGEMDAWANERYNRSSGTMEAFVKNGRIEEYGAISVIPCNGGLKRV